MSISTFHALPHITRERSITDAIEWAAVDRENGFIHLRAFAECGNGRAHGLGPVWNGAGMMFRLKALLAGKAT